MNWYSTDENDGINEYLKQLMISWEKEGIKSWMHAKNESIIVSEFIVPEDERNQGIGSQKMKELLDYAKAIGYRVLLTPSTDFGASSLTRLKKFYKNLGFVDNKGRNKDYRTKETMIWDSNE